MASERIVKYGVLGTGAVGRALAGRLEALGHRVMIGGRGDPGEDLSEWLVGRSTTYGTYREVAAFGDVLINCTKGTASVEALEMAGEENFSGKILVDIANPLDFSGGFPPRLSIINDDSLGEVLQRRFPKARVVKTLNTVANSVMVDPMRLGAMHSVFVSGNDLEAKAVVVGILESFGWQSIVDLGDISTARGTEQWMAMWTRLFKVAGTAEFNIVVVREGGATGLL